MGAGWVIHSGVGELREAGGGTQRTPPGGNLGSAGVDVWREGHALVDGATLPQLGSRG